ncbi:acetyl-CoA carboxylase biotin carboxyl carrier protein subunit [Mangrovimonas aestuarii]|uniref:acetyl-CoA carboxylase biotin carboxyl carrier protein subunit n=1 Tax=Mangrovimonas aestuarii TaxID=3018443 RepID=UPI002378A903|nr:acetyl-CoA carboxylase biotin carboxyl carrier protein subunit [Mangrovimonas aestuarii]
MAKHFKAQVNNTYDFSLTDVDMQHMDVQHTEGSEFHILENHTAYKAKLIDSNILDKSYKISVNNNVYEVQLADELDMLIKEMGFSIGAAKTVTDIKAPMPGLILDISVSAGQEVSENDPLLILEAMKMENSIVSPRAGVIKSITVSQGEAVDKNQLLIEFEQ